MSLKTVRLLWHFRERWDAPACALHICPVQQKYVHVRVCVCAPTSGSVWEGWHEAGTAAAACVATGRYKEVSVTWQQRLLPVHLCLALKLRVLLSWTAPEGQPCVFTRQLSHPILGPDLKGKWDYSSSLGSHIWHIQPALELILEFCSLIK